MEGLAERVLAKLTNKEEVSAEDLDSVLGDLLLSSGESLEEEGKQEVWATALSDTGGETLLALAECEHLFPLLSTFLQVANAKELDGLVSSVCYIVLNLLTHAQNDVVKMASGSPKMTYEFCTRIGEKISDGRNPTQQELRIDVLLRLHVFIGCLDPKLAERIRTILPNPVQKALLVSTNTTSLFESSLRHLTNEINENNKKNIESIPFLSFSQRGTSKSKASGGWIDFCPTKFYLYFEGQEFFTEFEYSSLTNVDIKKSGHLAFSSEKVSNDVRKEFGVEPDDNGLYNITMSIHGRKAERVHELMLERLEAAEKGMDESPTAPRKLSAVTTKKDQLPLVSSASKQTPRGGAENDKVQAMLDDEAPFEHLWPCLEEVGWTKKIPDSNGSGTESPLRYFIPDQDPDNARIGRTMFDSETEVIKYLRVTKTVSASIVTSSKKSSGVRMSMNMNEDMDVDPDEITSPEASQNKPSVSVSGSTRTRAKMRPPAPLPLPGSRETTPAKETTTSKCKRTAPAARNDKPAPVTKASSPTVARMRKHDQVAEAQADEMEAGTDADADADAESESESEEVAQKAKKQKVGVLKSRHQTSTSSSSSSSSSSKISEPKVNHEGGNVGKRGATPGVVSKGAQGGKAGKSQSIPSRTSSGGRRGVNENVKNVDTASVGGKNKKGKTTFSKGVHEDDDDDDDDDNADAAAPQMHMGAKSESGDEDEAAAPQPTKQNLFDLSQNGEGTGSLFQTNESDLLLVRDSGTSHESPSDDAPGVSFFLGSGSGGQIENADDDDDGDNEGASTVEKLLETLSKKLAQMEFEREQRKIARQVVQATDQVCQQVTAYLVQWGHFHQNAHDHQEAMIGSKFDSYRDMAEQINISITSDTEALSIKVKELLAEGRDLAERNANIKAQGKDMFQQIKMDDKDFAKELGERKNEFSNSIKRNLNKRGRSPGSV